MKLFVAIISCHAHRHKRDACRETWITHLPADTPYFFYLGEGESELETTGVVETPFPDIRTENARKTHMMFGFALSYEWDWLFRVDDDTFVVPERIPSLFWEPKAELIGGDCMWQWGWSTGGAGLMLSRRVVEFMVNAGVPKDNPDGDDGWICKQARLAGAALYWTPRLRHQYDIRPHPNNDLVTGHYVTPREMRVLQPIMDNGDIEWLRKTGVVRK